MLIAVGNSGDADLAAVAEGHLADASPLVRGAAVWALANLAPAAIRALKASHERAETDPNVLEEWREIA